MSTAEQHPPTPVDALASGHASRRAPGRRFGAVQRAATAAWLRRRTGRRGAGAGDVPVRGGGAAPGGVPPSGGLPDGGATAAADLSGIGHRVIGWLRWLFVGQTVVVNVLRLHTVRDPRMVVLATLGMVVWTVVLGRLDRLRTRHPVAVGGVDMAFTMFLILMSPMVVGMDPDGRMLLPVFWELMAPMAVAVWGGFTPGLAAGVLCGLAIGATDPYLDALEVALILVNPVASGAAGLMMDAVRQVVADRDRQQARAAAIAERERLSRIVHDGTLQVLALVEREGRTLGPEGERLARLASAQEARLRALLQDRTLATDDARTIDVVSMLDQRESDVVTVSAMADQLLLDAARARELDLVVGELITNVHRHAGEGARAWVLVEHEDDEVVVWFRDDGVGMAPEQLEEALRQGRMGISGSVAGRMAALGGSAVVTSRPGRGVEWELRLPLPRP